MAKSKSLVPVKFKNMLKKLGAALLPDTDKHRFRMDIPSETSDSIYVVSQRISNGNFECGCKGWIFHRKCKHLTAIKPVLEQLNKMLPLEKARKKLK